MFLSMATWVTGAGEAMGSVAMASNLVTIIMAVVAATLVFAVLVIMGEWLQGWLTDRRRNASKRRAAGSNRPHWRILHRNG